MRLSRLVLATALLAGGLSSMPCRADAEIRSWIDANGTPVFSNLASGSSATGRPHQASAAPFAETAGQPSGAQAPVAQVGIEPESGSADKELPPVEHDALLDH